VSVQLLAVLVNAALAVMKFSVGTIAGSRALVDDAFNSTGDVVTTCIAYFAFRYGLKPPDADHHYGHGNAEALAGLLIGATICATGIFICADGVLGAFSQHEAPQALALWGAGVTAVVKEFLCRISLRVGKRTNSPTLLASARDHRADVFAALIVFVGVALARLGWPMFDPIAGVAIGLYIFFLGHAPLHSNLAILMHQSPPELDRLAAHEAAKVPGVNRVGLVRVQPLGGSLRMDMVLLVDGGLTVAEAHEIAHEAEKTVMRAVQHVKEVHVHVEPV